MSGGLGQVLCEIVDIALNDDPQVVLGFVFGDLVCGEGFRHLV